MTRHASSDLVGVVAVMLLAAASLVGFGVGRVTVRHDLNAERRARCAAEVRLDLAHDPSRRPRHAFIEAGPDADCQRLEALRREAR